jgi:hypothetical protein
MREGDLPRPATNFVKKYPTLLPRPILYESRYYANAYENCNVTKQGIAGQGRFNVREGGHKSNKSDGSYKVWLSSTALIAVEVVK